MRRLLLYALLGHDGLTNWYIRITWNTWDGCVLFVLFDFWGGAQNTHTSAHHGPILGAPSSQSRFYGSIIFCVQDRYRQSPSCGTIMANKQAKHPDLHTCPESPSRGLSEISPISRPEGVMNQKCEKRSKNAHLHRVGIL